MGVDCLIRVKVTHCASVIAFVATGKKSAITEIHPSKNQQFKDKEYNDLEDELSVQNQGKKYNYKINTNLSYGFLKNRILELLYQQAPLDEIFQELETLFLKNTVPIRNDRTQPRNMDKYKHRRIPKVTKNQKDAI